MDATKTEIPEMDHTPKKCLPCDMMVSLGLISATCQSLPQNEQSKCYQLMRPLEEKRGDPADVLADIIVLTGDTNLNDTLDRMNLIIFQATTKAKEKLIAKGVLNADGTPKEMK